MNYMQDDDDNCPMTMNIQNDDMDGYIDEIEYP